MAERRNYAYICTDATGSMVGKVEVGGAVIDTFHGKEYTWTIYDFKKGEVSGTFTGRLVGKIARKKNGDLDAASVKMIEASKRVAA